MTHPKRGEATMRLTPNEHLALVGLGDTHSDDWCFPFRVIAEKGGLDAKLVRRAVRSLARKGLAEYHRGLWDESPDRPAGAGYCITPAGRAILNRAEADRGE